MWPVNNLLWRVRPVTQQNGQPAIRLPRRWPAWAVKEGSKSLHRSHRTPHNWSKPRRELRGRPRRIRCVREQPSFCPQPCRPICKSRTSWPLIHEGHEVARKEAETRLFVHLRTTPSRCLVFTRRFSPTKVLLVCFRFFIVRFSLSVVRCPFGCGSAALCPSWIVLSLRVHRAV